MTAQRVFPERKVTESAEKTMYDQNGPRSTRGKWATCGCECLSQVLSVSIVIGKADKKCALKAVILTAYFE